MKTFTDTNGRDWRLDVNMRTVKTLREEMGINLLALLDDQAAVLRRITGDLCEFVDVLWFTCQAQAEERGIDAAAFAQALAGDVLDDAAEKWFEALVDFFPNPRAREQLRAIWKKAKEVGGKVVERATTELDRVMQLDPDKMVDKMIAAMTTAND